MTMTKHLIITLLMALTGLAQVGAQAPPYEKTGMINAVYADENRVMIGDYTFDVLPYVQVNDGSTKIGPHHLRADTPVGFKTEVVNGKRVVTEVWILNELPGPNSPASQAP